MKRTSLALLAAGAAALAAPGAASAATFGTATPLAGFGTAPALSQVQTSALFDDGRSAVVGYADDDAGDGTQTRRIAFAAGQPGELPAPATRLGRSGPFDLDVDTDPDGLVSSTWTVGHVAYLSRCSDGGCAPTARVGTSPLKPQSSVAVQPGTGRTIVMWRGSTRRGLRLQWRVTTGSKLGAVHTLGEGGTVPQLATDDSGRTVAIWKAADGSLRTASRRRGEFTRPTTVPDSADASSPQLVVNVRTGRWIAGWLSGSLDVQDPAGTIRVASRGNPTSFGGSNAVGPANAFALTAAPGGNAMVVALQQGTTDATVLAARSTGGPFGALAPVGAAPFLAATYPPRGAIDDAGNALVSWTTPGATGSSAGAGTYATTTATPGGAFGLPQALGDADGANPTAPSIGRGIAQVAFTTPTGPQLARAPS